MANAGTNEHEWIFTGEELKDIHVLRTGGDYIEVTCGCTSRKYGDTTGRLRIFVGGQLEISCECVESCSEGTSLSLSHVFALHTKWVVKFRHAS